MFGKGYPVKPLFRFLLSVQFGGLLSRSVRFLLVLSFILCLDAGVGLGQTDAALDTSFGPTLYLIAAPTGELPPELPPIVIPHARLEDAGGVWFVASGPAEAWTDLQAAGLPARVLDPDTTGRVYYWVDTETAGARELASTFGDMLFIGSRELLVGLAPEQELPFLETLPAQGINVSLLAASP